MSRSNNILSACYIANSENYSENDDSISNDGNTLSVLDSSSHQQHVFEFDQVYTDEQKFNLQTYNSFVFPQVQQAINGESSMVVFGGSQSFRLNQFLLSQTSMEGLITQAASQLLHSVNSDDQKKGSVTFSWFRVGGMAPEIITDVLRTVSQSQSGANPQHHKPEAAGTLTLRELGRGRGMAVPGLWEVEIASGTDIEAVVSHVLQILPEFADHSNGTGHLVMQLTVTNNQEPVREPSPGKNKTPSVGGDSPGVGRITFLMLSGFSPIENPGSTVKPRVKPHGFFPWVEQAQVVLQFLGLRRSSPPFHKSRVLLLLKDVLLQRQSASFVLMLKRGSTQHGSNLHWLQLFTRMLHTGIPENLVSSANSSPVRGGFERKSQEEKNPAKKEENPRSSSAIRPRPTSTVTRVTTTQNSRNSENRGRPNPRSQPTVGTPLTTPSTIMPLGGTPTILSHLSDNEENPFSKTHQNTENNSSRGYNSRPSSSRYPHPQQSSDQYTTDDHDEIDDEMDNNGEGGLEKGQSPTDSYPGSEQQGLGSLDHEYGGSGINTSLNMIDEGEMYQETYMQTPITQLQQSQGVHSHRQGQQQFVGNRGQHHYSSSDQGSVQSLQTQQRHFGRQNLSVGGKSGNMSINSKLKNINSRKNTPKNGFGIDGKKSLGGNQFQHDQELEDAHHETEAALSMALEASRSEAAALRVACAYSTEQLQDLRQQHETLLQQLKEEGSMLQQRDRERFKRALKDLADYEVYKEVMEAAMLRIQNDLETALKENEDLKKSRVSDAKQAKKQKNFSERYTKDLVSTKKKLAEFETKFHETEKKMHRVIRERDTAIQTLSQVKAGGARRDGEIQTALELRNNEISELRKKIQELEDKNYNLEIDKKSILASTTSETEKLRSAHSKALEMLMGYQEENDLLRSAVNEMTSLKKEKNEINSEKPSESQKESLKPSTKKENPQKPIKSNDSTKVPNNHLVDTNSEKSEKSTNSVKRLWPQVSVLDPHSAGIRPNDPPHQENKPPPPPVRRHSFGTLLADENVLTKEKAIPPPPSGNRRETIRHMSVPLLVTQETGFPPSYPHSVPTQGGKPAPPSRSNSSSVRGSYRDSEAGEDWTSDGQIGGLSPPPPPPAPVDVK